METKKKYEPPSSFLRIKFALQIVYNQKYKISIDWFPELSFIYQRLKLTFVICIFAGYFIKANPTPSSNVGYKAHYFFLCKVCSI
jgi:hypothetical protein